jgi:hypothetical protein
MSAGFTFVATDGGGRVAKWAEGVPVRSMWGGLKLRTKAMPEIQTWRCNRCGFLESYANG